MPTTKQFASAVAEYCGLLPTHHFHGGGFSRVASRRSAQLDEPLGDPAALPTSKMCHWQESVKIVLSGEGADELFTGTITTLPTPQALGWNGCSVQDLPRPVRLCWTRTPSQPHRASHWSAEGGVGQSRALAPDEERGSGLSGKINS